MPSVESSKRFLASYLDSLVMIKQAPNADMLKGKSVVSYDQGFTCNTKVSDGRQKNNVKWLPPEEGMAKLNTDGSFVSMNEAGEGMVLRDHTGTVICAAMRNLRYCNDATDAELAAIEDGIAWALNWTELGFTVETDCAEAIQLIRDDTPNTSIYAARVQVIREMMRERDVVVVKISREANRASHELAKLGRVQDRTATWLRSFPLEIATVIHSDCNSINS
ncbi:hypothetical protein QYE76_016301 [Lolium multiflorum]|uniref:RNase H type-1 domain-containing protein n=1 Tax=Lolium multiflorum TaxID=4521 RepID=A0AAD8XAL5_LOLMU|nr:hypothetical protein QYE76_016301 [Lolium multiflorum]